MIDEAEQSTNGETEENVTGITGSKNESINIPTEILQGINSSGMYVYMYICTYYLPILPSNVNFLFLTRQYFQLYCPVHFNFRAHCALCVYTIVSNE